MFERERSHWFVAAAFVVFVGVAPEARSEEPYPIEWVRQFGTEEWDSINDLAMSPNGMLIACGSTGGVDFNDPLQDAFLMAMDPSGDTRWARHFGSDAADGCSGLAVDSNADVWIGGPTQGNIGAPNKGSTDIYLSKFNESGKLLFSRQLGGKDGEGASDLAIDRRNNVYFVGTAYGGFVRPVRGYTDLIAGKFDSAGNEIWTRQFGGALADYGSAIAVDVDEDVILVSETELAGHPGNFDAVLSRLNGNGDELWTRTFGGDLYDRATSTVVDRFGNSYMSGFGNFRLDDGADEMFVSKYSVAGQLLWSLEFGTDEVDWAKEMALDRFGNVFLTGATMGDLGGLNAGDFDIVVSKVSSDGALLWIKQIGTSATDWGIAITVDVMGNVYLGGHTDGELDGQNQGQNDAFVAKLSSGLTLCDAIGLIGTDDGDVDLDDLNNVKNFFGTDEFSSDTDADFDVDLDDLNNVRNCFGVPRSSNAVPEPAGWGLVLVALLAAGAASGLSKGR